MLLDNARKLIEANLENRYEEAAILSDLIKSASSEKDKVECLRFVIENYGLLEHTGVVIPTTGRRMTAERWTELRKTEGKVIDAQIDRAFLNLPTPEEASKRLLAICEIQPNDEMRDFFLANVLADSKVPYVELPPGHMAVKMSDDQFKALNKKLIRQIRQIQYVITDADYEQKTERASLLLSILNSVQDPSEKVILMTHILNVPERAAKRLLMDVLEKR